LKKLAFKNSPIIKIEHLLNLNALKHLEMNEEEGVNTEEFVQEVF